MGAKRYKVQEDVMMQLMGNVGDFSAQLRNISDTGGLLVVFDGNYIPQRGDLVVINTEFRAILGEVVWTNLGNIGVCFFTPQESKDRMMAKTSFGMSA